MNRQDGFLVCDSYMRKIRLLSVTIMAISMMIICNACADSGQSIPIPGTINKDKIFCPPGVIRTEERAPTEPGFG